MEDNSLVPRLLREAVTRPTYQFDQAAAAAVLGAGREASGVLAKGSDTIRRHICQRKQPNITRRHRNIINMPHIITRKRLSITRLEITRKLLTILIRRWDTSFTPGHMVKRQLRRTRKSTAKNSYIGSNFSSSRIACGW